MWNTGYKHFAHGGVSTAICKGAIWMTSRVLPATEPLLTQTLDCAGIFSAAFIDDISTDGLVILQVRGTDTFYCGVSEICRVTPDRLLCCVQ